MIIFATKAPDKVEIYDYGRQSASRLAAPLSLCDRSASAAAHMIMVGRPAGFP